MKGALGSLAWLMLAFVGGLIVIILLLLWVNSSNAVEGGLGWGILLGFLFLLAIIGCTLIAVILGITGCRAARQRSALGLVRKLSVADSFGRLRGALLPPGDLSHRADRPFTRRSALPAHRPRLALVTTSFTYRREEA